jgi:stage III sporulation protein AA
VRNVESLAIRIPRRAKLDAGGVRGMLESFGMSAGLLVFSPPLGGKTSFLREVARELASGREPLRVVVVDTRGELGFSLDSPRLCLDLLRGYPKKEGLEIAARTLGAQVVICDEIGAGESDAVCELHGGGVPLIASAHAAGLSDLLCRRGIAELHRARVFGGYMRVTRGSPPYVFYPWEEGDGA